MAENKAAGEKHGDFPRRFGVDRAASEGGVFLDTQPETAKPTGFEKCRSPAGHQEHGKAEV